jgi:proteasome accessory factor A
MATVMGGETEYAISARDRAGRVIPQGPLLTRFFDHTKATLGYTSASTRGRFLSNGGLLYLDAGLHMEVATPEVTSPFEVVRYLAAGDRILRDLAHSLQASSQEVGEIFCSRASVDYVSRTLWAAHESYMHRVNVNELPSQLIPFLASRVILGAGGWDYRSPALQFTRSPRAHFITRQTDSDSQHVRPLFHSKNEPHSGTGTSRLHVSCSESLCSERANILRFGTTALVLATIEAGARPGDAMQLTLPIWALDRFATGPLRTSASLAGGGRTTALQIQRHYLASVESYRDRIALPWADEVCHLWRETLDDLDGDGPLAAVTLDWAIKLRLFKRRLEQRGIAWTSLPLWGSVIARLRRQWLAGPAVAPEFDIAHALEPDLWMKAEMDQMSPMLRVRGLSWDQLPAFVAARNELFELDAKYGGLGDEGVFNTLDRAGALRHHVHELDVDDAVLNPPQDTRARIRGEVVRRLSDAGVVYRAEWTHICDFDRKRQLDLTDPFEAEERWEGMHSLDRLRSCWL